MISRALSLKSFQNAPFAAKTSDKISMKASAAITLEELAALDSECQMSDYESDDSDQDDDSVHQPIFSKKVTDRMKSSGEKSHKESGNDSSDVDSPDIEKDSKENGPMQKYEIKLKEIDASIHLKTTELKKIFDVIETKSKSYNTKFKRHSAGLIEALAESFNSVASCVESQKKAYIERLKSSQEVSNAATRNVIQTAKVLLQMLAFCIDYSNMIYLYILYIR
jgi:hypothetical protein